MQISKLKYFLLLTCLLFQMRSLFAIDGHPTPKANFEMSGFCWGSVTNFSNTSSDLSNPAWKWTIWQQGVSSPVLTSTNITISFQFPAKTSYTVSLEVWNYVTATHFHYDNIEKVVVLDSFPIANFSLQECQSVFSNLSCCTNTCIWDFGDGSPTSTLTSPAHTYTAYANYTVTLIAGNGSVSDTITKVVYPYPNTWTGNFSIVTNPDSVTFMSLDDSIKGSLALWLWDFGDGSFMSSVGGWKVRHHYEPDETDSTYIVKAYVKDNCYQASGENSLRIKGTGRTITGTHVYPSPVVHGYLNVETGDMSDLKEIKIIDCLGKSLNDLVPSPGRFGYYIYIGHIPAGIYIVQVVFSDRTENYKIIKQ
jgi:PKD repeat protein